MQETYLGFGPGSELVLTLIQAASIKNTQFPRSVLLKVMQTFAQLLARALGASARVCLYFGGSRISDTGGVLEAELDIKTTCYRENRVL